MTLVTIREIHTKKGLLLPKTVLHWNYHLDPIQGPAGSRFRDILPLPRPVARLLVSGAFGPGFQPLAPSLIEAKLSSITFDVSARQSAATSQLEKSPLGADSYGFEPTADLSNVSRPCARSQFSSRLGHWSSAGSPLPRPLPWAPLAKTWYSDGTPALTSAS